MGWLLVTIFCLPGVWERLDGERLLNESWCAILFILYLDEAVLSYERKKNMIEMYDTEVPMDWQGKGVAGQLAKVTHQFSNSISII